jgi:hypothetical protein
MAPTSTGALCPADPEDPTMVSEASRPLGLIVARGTAVTVVAPSDGTLAIDNPFVQPAAAAQQQEV